MELGNALAWAASRKHGSLITIRKDGRPQSSDIVYVVEGGSFLISLTDDEAKTRNIRRDSRVVLHLSDPDSWSYLSFDGTVELSGIAANPHDATAARLVAYYRALAGEHDDWAEYRQAVIKEKRLIATFTPRSVVQDVLWSGRASGGTQSSASPPKTGPVESLAFFDAALNTPHAQKAVKALIDCAIDGQPSSHEIDPPTARHLCINQRLTTIVDRTFPGAVSQAELNLVGLQQLALEQMGREVSSTLVAHQIDYRVLKGMATRDLDYCSPEFRQFGDIDILVRKDSIARLRSSLGNVGFVNREILELDSFETNKGLTLLSPTGRELDVHHRLFRTTLQAEETMFDSPVATSDGSSAMPVEHRLVHAAGHAVFSRNVGALTSLLDCAVIAHRTGVSWDKVDHIATEFGVSRLVSVALDHLEAISERPLPGRPRCARNRLPDALSVAYLGKRRHFFVEQWLIARTIPLKHKFRYFSVRIMLSKDQRAAAAGPVRLRVDQ